MLRRVNSRIEDDAVRHNSIPSADRERKILSLFLPSSIFIGNGSRSAINSSNILDDEVETSRWK